MASTCSPNGEDFYVRLLNDTCTLWQILWISGLYINSNWTVPSLQGYKIFHTALHIPYHTSTIVLSSQLFIFFAYKVEKKTLLLKYFLAFHLYASSTNDFLWFSWFYYISFRFSSPKKLSQQMNYCHKTSHKKK